MRSACVSLAFLFVACGVEPAVDTSAPLIEASGHWRAMKIPARVGQRHRHSAIFTGSKMIIYGGIPDGPRENYALAAEYDPATDTWTELPDGPVGWRTNHFAAWTGDRMLVWGGWGFRSDGTLFRSGKGALYDPATRSWTPIATSMVAWRQGSAVVWAANTRQIIALGGNSGDSPYFEDYPLVYDLGTDSWAFRQTTPLVARAEAGGLWTGDTFVYFGGRYYDFVEGQGPVLRGSSRGEEYDPLTQKWSLYRDADNVGALDITDAPTRRAFNLRTGEPGGVTISATRGAPAAWYGGKDFASAWDDTDTGTLYVPGSPPSWKKLVVRDREAAARRGATAWTSPTSLFVWGGFRGTLTFDTGLEVIFGTGETRMLPPTPATLPPRREASVVWTGAEAILYGGWCDADSEVDCATPAGTIYTP